MNNIKTATIIFLALFALSILLYFVPFNALISQIPYFSDIYSQTSVSINTENGKANVKVNGKDYGETPVTINDLKPGEQSIVIEKITSAPDFYKPLEIELPLENKTEAIINIELGPSGENHGYILYYTKSYKSLTQQGYLTLKTEEENSKVYLDEVNLGTTPIKTVNLNAKTYELKITKDGYDELKFPIIVRNGYNLNIKTFQLPIPTNLTK